MLAYLATPRAAAVQKFFRTTGTYELLGAYAWCQAVSAALLPILGDFEIALRNALHRTLSQHYGGKDSYGWMQAKPGASAKAKPIPAPHKMGPRMQSDLATLEQKLQASGKATPDDIVAALPFGFWEQLINGLSNKVHAPGLQQAILATVFPDAPDTKSIPHGDIAFRTRVVSLLFQIRGIRNRIGHHDSIWTCPEFNEYGLVGFYPRRPRHTINSLRLLADKITWFAGWIDADITSHIHDSDHWHSFQTLLSREALAIYRHTGGKAGTSSLLFKREAEAKARLTRQRKVDISLPRHVFYRGYY